MVRFQHAEFFEAGGDVGGGYAVMTAEAFLVAGLAFYSSAVMVYLVGNTLSAHKVDGCSNDKHHQENKLDYDGNRRCILHSHLQCRPLKLTHLRKRLTCRRGMASGGEPAR